MRPRMIVVAGHPAAASQQSLGLMKGRLIILTPMNGLES
jgi:prephenate dehydrogenase